MIDGTFIKTILQKGEEAKNKVSLEFSGVSLEQLNWKPSLQSWSIAQCLEHLIISHNSYGSYFGEIAEGNYKMNFWQSYSPFTHLSGKLMKQQLQEHPKRKFKAPKKIQPAASEMKMEIIDRYQENLETFLDQISKCRNIDIDKTIITSPILSIVTYSLRDAFQFLMQHEHRHINQAIRVKANKDFPKNN